MTSKWDEIITLIAKLDPTEAQRVCDLVDDLISERGSWRAFMEDKLLVAETTARERIEAALKESISISNKWAGAWHEMRAERDAAEAAARGYERAWRAEADQADEMDVLSDTREAIHRWRTPCPLCESSVRKTIDRTCRLCGGEYK